MVHSITSRDWPPVRSTVPMFMPKPMKMMAYCNIFFPQKVMPRSRT